MTIWVEEDYDDGCLGDAPENSVRDRLLPGLQNYAASVLHTTDRLIDEIERTGKIPDNLVKKVRSIGENGRQQELDAADCAGWTDKPDRRTEYTQECIQSRGYTREGDKDKVVPNTPRPRKSWW
jgi:hypothetical protein